MNKRQILLGAAALGLTGVGVCGSELRRMGSMEDYDASVAATRRILAARPQTRDLIRYAALAPNGHNTQPWRFQVSESQIRIVPDFARRTPIVDPDDHHLFVSLGAAAENLAIACAARDRAGEVSFSGDGHRGITVSFGGGGKPEPRMLEAITRRQSTRTEYDGRAVSAADLLTLETSARTPGVDLVLITDRPQMSRVRDLVLAGNSTQLSDLAFLQELKSWIRYSPRQAMTTGDGLFAAASGNPTLPDWLGPYLFAMTFRAGTDNDKYARQIQSSAGLAVFVSARADKEYWVRTGRACQRFALRATALGMKVAFLNQPVEVAQLRPELAALVGLPGRRPDIVMRFGYGPTLPYSSRRPVEAVLA